MTWHLWDRDGDGRWTGIANRPEMGTNNNYREDSQMRLPVTDQQGGGPVLPEDTYRVKVVKIEECTSSWEGVEKPALQFHFEVVDDGDYDGQYVGEVVKAKAVIYPKLSPKAKLRQFAEVLLGHLLAEGEILDTDELVGKTCRLLTVTNRVQGSDGKTREYTNVDKLLPLKGGRAQTAEHPLTTSRQQAANY